MNEAVIVAAVRTPFGRFGGRLKALSAVDLGAHAAQAAIERCGLQPADIDETIFGTAILAAATSVAARQINFKIGIPASTPSLTLDRACCSSMTALGLALAKIRAGDARTVLAGGVESCSRTPFLLKGTRWGRQLGDFTVEDPMQVRNPITGLALTLVTGRKALEHGVSREEQDAWACASHEKYFAAFDRGDYAEEIVPVAQDDGPALAVDESARRETSLDRLRALPTVYGSPTVTAGNAPGLNDGGSAVIVMAAEEARRRGITPLGQIMSYAQMSGDLESSVSMPGHALLKALDKAEVGLEEVRRIEINEAFAAMPLVSTKVVADGDRGRLERLRRITNVNGGAVAIGHPPGASGARIAMAALRELRRLGGGHAAAAICGGYGQSDAVVLKA